MRRLAIVVLLLAFSVFALAQRPIKIKVGDVLAVAVFGSEAYSGDFAVLTDGSITGPGFGRIVADGQTEIAVQNAISKRLLKYLKRPIVTVFIKVERPQYVFVSGAHTLNSVGLTYVPGMDLRQVIGSVDLPADPDQLEAEVFRHNQEPKLVSLFDLLHSGPKDVDILLQPNDMVSIHPLDYVRVWVTGMVHVPGQIRVPLGSDAFKAIAQSGGVAYDFLHSEDVAIYIRRGPTVIPLPSQDDQAARAVPLEAGDTVVVEKPPQVRVTVGGEVNKPGSIELRERSSVVTAISTAGGLTPIGGLQDVLILRKGEALQVDAIGVQTGKAEPQFMLEDGDTVYVRPNQRFFVVVGTVQRAGRYMMDEDKTYHLADALASGGGLSSLGTLRRVYLARKGPGGHFTATPYNLDEFLKDGKLASNPEIASGDVVLFTEPKGITANTLSQILSTALILASLKKL